MLFFLFCEIASNHHLSTISWKKKTIYKNKSCKLAQITQYDGNLDIVSEGDKGCKNMVVNCIGNGGNCTLDCASGQLGL